MQDIPYYINKLGDLSNDELKDIIAERFRSYSEAEIAAAIELISWDNERGTESQASFTHNLNSMTTAELLQIVQNEALYGADKVSDATAEILRRENTGLKGRPPKTAPFIQVFKAVFAMIGLVAILKIVLLFSMFIFLLQSINSCLN